MAESNFVDYVKINCRSGKGTQSDKMIEKYGLGHISTGDVLRNEIKNGTELGKTAKGYIDNGQLIPDELMIDILASVYDSFAKDHAGVIFDGFPRTTPQAEALKKMNPASVEVCSLLVKPGNLKVDLDINYAVMEIPNDFIVGYGLDYDQEGRNLRDIYTIVEE